MTYKGYISGFNEGIKEGKKQERQRIIDILLCDTNFTWIYQEGTQLISEIIKEIEK